jgi:hypothetical protein
MLPREMSLAARRRLAEPADVHSSAGGSPKGTAVFRNSSEPRGANSESRISRFRFAFVRVHGN